MSSITEKTGLFKSSLSRKYFMALSGLFLCLFLVVHLLGNMQLFYRDGGESFNKYTWFMTHNPLIKIVSYVNYAFILIHILDGFLLTRLNKNARPVSYNKTDQRNSSSWSSRNMGILGTIILVFLVVHLKTFWYEMHFGTVEEVTYEGSQEIYKDLYKVVLAAFSQGWYAALYIFSMFALSYHLYHGFQSAFQTLGINHYRYTPIIKFVGIFFFAIIIPGLFASMPLYFFLLTL